MVREGRMGSGRATRKNGRKEKGVTEGRMETDEALGGNDE